MTLILSSGGGRLGNQILNLIHLTALSNEYDIEFKKLSDLFIEAQDKSIIYKIEKNNINWRIIYEDKEKNLFNKIFLKFFIRLIHLLFYISPNKKSYKIGYRNNFPKFIIGKKLSNNITSFELVKEAKIFDIVLTGWGFRDWELVVKYKDQVVKNISKGFDIFTKTKNDCQNDYLFVHIRRSDFLQVNELKELNFVDSLWLKSIIKVAFFESIKRVVIFSDSNISNSFISSLNSQGIDVIFLHTGKENNGNFLEFFVRYLYGAKAVICNASTLVMSISFLYHDFIYLPSRKKEFQRLDLNQAHTSFPSSLNWN